MTNTPISNELASALPMTPVPPAVLHQEGQFVTVLPTILQQLDDHLDLTLAARQQHDNFYLLNLEGQTIVALTHPAHAQHVFQRLHIYPKAFHRSVATPNDEARLGQLQLLRLQFHRRRLAALCELMVTTIDAELQQLTKSSRFFHTFTRKSDHFSHTRRYPKSKRTKTPVEKTNIKVNRQLNQLFFTRKGQSIMKTQTNIQPPSAKQLTLKKISIRVLTTAEQSATQIFPTLDC